MIHTFHIDTSNPYAKAVVDFLKTLDFVKQDENENLAFTLSDQELEVLNKRRENRLFRKSKRHSWDEVKEFARSKKA